MAKKVRPVAATLREEQQIESKSSKLNEEERLTSERLAGLKIGDWRVDEESKVKRVSSAATNFRKAFNKAHGMVTMETGSVRGLLAKNVRVAHKLYSQKYNIEGASVTDLDNISVRIEQTLEQ
ncbi:hypothetical protein BGZ67_000451, partial [Mortierella alpina]